MINITSHLHQCTKKNCFNTTLCDENSCGKKYKNIDASTVIREACQSGICANGGKEHNKPNLMFFKYSNIPEITRPQKLLWHTRKGQQFS